MGREKEKGRANGKIKGRERLGEREGEEVREGLLKTIINKGF